MIKDLRINNKELNNIIKEIIFEQSNIVGTNISYERALATKLIEINNNEIRIKSDPKVVLKRLINSYSEIFGEASVEVCEEVIKNHLTISTKNK